jgi:hypothetical protein
MPNILRRPMFRGGKPNAYGTGITSNLESRRGFAEGPEEEMRQQILKKLRNHT